jgi:hypothetical protein
VAGCCECGNEPLGSIKCGEFLDQVKTCQLLRKTSANVFVTCGHLPLRGNDAFVHLFGHWSVSHVLSENVTQKESPVVVYRLQGQTCCVPASVLYFTFRQLTDVLTITHALAR